MKKFLIATAVFSVATPAVAQDDASFTGPRIEALVGYDAIDTNSVIGTPDGVFFGAAAGYDFQAGSAVLGLEAEVADSTAKRTFGGVKIESDRDLYVGGRAGIVLSPKALVYVKAGYTNARIDTDLGNANADGVRVGTGVEYKLSQKFFLKAEYRYSNYEAGVERHQAVTGFGVRF